MGDGLRSESDEAFSWRVVNLLLLCCRASIFVGAEMVRPSIAPCAHCARPLHPIPDQPAGQTHCNSGVSKHPPKPPIPSKTLFFSMLFISKLKVLVSSSGIRILKERREEKQKIKFPKTERNDAWCASERSLNPSTNLLGDLFCLAEKSQSTCFADDPSPSLVSILCPELHHPSSSLEYYPWLWCLCLHGYCCYLASLLVHWNHKVHLTNFQRLSEKKLQEEPSLWCQWMQSSKWWVRNKPSEVLSACSQQILSCLYALDLQ